MQIPGLLGMYFDAVVVCIGQDFFTFIQIGSGHTVQSQITCFQSFSQFFLLVLGVVFKSDL